MTCSDACTDGLLMELFLDLPWPVLQEVCLHLSAGFVYIILKRVPKCRDFVAWYTGQLEVHLLPGDRRGYFRCKSSTDPKVLELYGYDETRIFFASYPDLVPKCIKVAISGDFAPAKTVLLTFHERITRASQLHVDIADCDLYPWNIEVLLSFQNLHTLQFKSGNIDPCLQALSRLFPFMQRLRKIELRLHAHIYPLRVELPPYLETLDLYVRGNGYDGSDTSEILSHVFPHPGRPSSAVVGSLMHPEFLRTLYLTTAWDTLNISLLPPNLETLHLLSHTDKIEYDLASSGWPESLRLLLIKSYSMENSVWEQLSKISWPPLLLTLTLNDLGLVSLNGLNLPNSLEHFELEALQLTSLQAAHNLDNYKFFRFPDSLKTLNLRKCDYIYWEEGHWGRNITLSDRITFPPNLESLDLSFCRLRRLAHFVFPSSLKTLILNDNEISNLNTYNLHSGKTRIVHWSQLVHLRTLSVGRNRLRNLNHWCPPKSLRRLDLNFNQLCRLVPKRTPLFQINFRESTNNMQHLNLRHNRIDEISSTLHLPENLVALDLELNELTDLRLFDALGSHETLQYLYLGFNKIRRVLTCGPALPHKSNLRKLSFEQIGEIFESWEGKPNIPAEQAFEMTAEEFYSVFELLGLSFAEKNGFIMRDHEFR